jgi:hypothetical protein
MTLVDSAGSSWMYRIELFLEWKTWNCGEERGEESREAQGMKSDLVRKKEESWYDCIAVLEEWYCLEERCDARS